MAYRGLIVALGMVVAVSPVSAQPDSGPIRADDDAPPLMAAPPGTPATQYCMRVTLTGNIVEPVRCWTRDQWAEQGVDVDKAWAREGVRTLG